MLPIVRPMTSNSVRLLRALGQQSIRLWHRRLKKTTPTEWVELKPQMSATGFMLTPRHNRHAILLSLTNHTSYHLGQAKLAQWVSSFENVGRCASGGRTRQRRKRLLGQYCCSLRICKTN